jgi:hypothetical protein
MVQEHEGVDLVNRGPGQRPARDKVPDVVAHRRMDADKAAARHRISPSRVRNCAVPQPRSTAGFRRARCLTIMARGDSA